MQLSQVRPRLERKTPVPIKKENLQRYPADWPQIRERIRQRAEDKCENCGVPNGALIYRDDQGDWHELGEDGRTYNRVLMSTFWAESMGFKVVKIVCTVAHLDHTPEHCSDDNLRFWCQRDHLAYDAEHHAQTAYATRREGRAVADLFAQRERE